MKILKSDLRKGNVTVKVENQDDLWYLSHIIDNKDILKGKTLRKIKIGGDEDRSKRIEKKSVVLSINVNKLEFVNNLLRVSGKISEGTQDISQGNYHTFNIDEGSIFTISKNKWYKFQKDKLKEATSQKVSKVLICVMDRENASFAIMKKYGFEVLSDITGVVEKKDQPQKIKSDFNIEIVDKLVEYDKRFKIDNIILASPSFFKENIIKLVNDVIRKKIVMAACNDTGISGITEVLKRPEVTEVLRQERISKELNLVEQLLAELSKEGKASYGIKATIQVAEAGGVKDLLLSDKFINQARESNSYDRIDSLMKLVDSMGAGIHIISSQHQGGSKLDGLGGVAALLRYKING